MSEDEKIPPVRKGRRVEPEVYWMVRRPRAKGDPPIVDRMIDTQHDLHRRERDEEQ